jgi:hypothetical protein
MERREVHKEFWWESQKQGDHQENLDVCGRIWILERENLMYLAQDRKQRRALVNTVIKLWIP